MGLIKYIDLMTNYFMKTPYTIIYVDVRDYDDISEQQCIDIFAYIFGFHPYLSNCGQTIGHDYRIELVDYIEYPIYNTSFYTIIDKHLLDNIPQFHNHNLIGLGHPCDYGNESEYYDLYRQIYKTPKFNSNITYIEF